MEPIGWLISNNWKARARRARRSHLREAGAQVRALLDGYQAKARCGGRRARARFARVWAAVVKEHEQAEFK